MRNKGITLIALVITIIILLILAGVSISALGGENGLITNALKAKEKTEVSEYKEKIELIRTELLIENRKAPTLEQLQNEFQTNHKSWVSSCKIETVDGKEKIILITKEGYRFYITETGTEYKGKDEIVDTNDLQREDVISLEIVGTITNGKIVKITDLSGKDYYELKYQIGSTDGEWLEINSGDTVEVEYGKIIYAKLVYVSESGKEHKVSIELENPIVEVKDIDTSNIIRKTEIAFADLFEITWGSDGTGTIEYSVSGNLTFNNTSFNNTEINNVSTLELGTYNVICKVTSPLNNTVTGEKEVKVTTLANTMVTNASNDSVDAKAIYSEYDLAHFRDLVNSGQLTINAKLMNNIDLVNVCSSSVGSWIPIGLVQDNWINYVSYMGIFDGQNNVIENLYIYSENYALGLFGSIEKGNVKKINVVGSIKADGEFITIGGIAGAIWNSAEINDCVNNVKIEAMNTDRVGGVVGQLGPNGGTIKNSYNNASITGKENVGGIAGRIIEDSVVSYCWNQNSVTGYSGQKENVGGIAGENYGTIDNCYNNASVSSAGSVVGGIAGILTGTIINCYNVGNVTSHTSGYVGGIIGKSIVKEAKLYNVYNAGDIIGKEYIGGIDGYITNMSGGNWLNAGKVSNTDGFTANETNGNDTYFVGLGNGYVSDTYWESGSSWITTDKESLKLYTENQIQLVLGIEFIQDTTGINNGFPILSWQYE